MSTAVLVAPQVSDNTRLAQIAALKRVALDRLASEHSKRAYSYALDKFLAWWPSSGYSALTRAAVAAYQEHLRSRGASPQTINQHLAAIRKLVSEAHANGALSDAVAASIATLEGEKERGKRIGVWLTREQAQRLLDLPDAATVRGMRDRALLAVLLGAGLRRSEAVALSVEHLQMRENRWVIVDVKGKGKKFRSIPIDAWVKTAVDEWCALASITSGVVFRPLNKGGRLVRAEHISDQTVHDTLALYVQRAGIAAAPHDMRRTFAKLAHKGGASLEQIQHSLGHASVKTTERYVAPDQDFTDAPSDHLGLRLNRS